MARRDIGIPVVIVYLLVWWGGFTALMLWVVSNSAPGVPTLAWKDEVATTSTKLAVDITADAPDADGDALTYTYTWKKDGEVVMTEDGSATYNAKTVSTKDTRKGQVWEVTVVADDGTMNGSGCWLPMRACATGAGASISTTIVNTPPRPRVRFVDAEGTEIEEYDGKKGSDITLSLSCFDPDFIDNDRDEAAARAASGEPPPAPPAEGEAAPEKPDPCTYTIAWYPADVEVEEGTEPEPAWTEPMLPAAEAKKAASWRVVVVANDGEEDGEPDEESIAAAVE
ncbi:MAG: hypothetical protein H6733_14040 [Alphaproteobacteria bacterium]|nr:hypothetical protein [Alphaproteobacteria bacterium]